MAGFNTKKKRRENYFQQNIARSGENFLETMPLDRMKMDAVKVFRELARGNIDISIFGKYFYNPNFLEACIDTAGTKHYFHSVSAVGVYTWMEMNKDLVTPEVHRVYEFHSNATAGYNLIRSKLIEFRNIGDVNILTDLVLNLVRYRYYI